MKPRIGLVGCGRWGRLILRDLKAIGCEVTVIAASAASQNNAHSFHADAVVSSIGDVDPAFLHGFVVASPAATHAEVIGRLLPLQLPVFCEKPLCDDPRLAAELAERAPERLFVMDKWKYHNGVLKLKAVIESGDFGALRRLELRRTQWQAPHSDVDAIWSLMPHDVSIVQHLLGAVPVPCFATGLVGEDGTRHAMRVEGGLRGVSVGIDVSAAHVATERSICAVLERGSLLLTEPSDAILAMHHPRMGFGASPERLAFVPNMPLLDELTAFVAYLEGEAPAPLSSARQACETVRFIDEVRRMAAGQAAA